MKNEFPVHLMWCKFLHRVPYEQWSEKVKEDFAGLELCETDEDVELWLHTFQHVLFYGRKHDTFRLSRHVAGDETEPFNLCLTIDVRSSDDYILTTVAKYLKLYREDLGITRTAGRPEFVARAGAYRLASRPDLNGLDICLTVLDVLKQHPELSKREVGERIAAEYPLAVKLKLQGASSERNKVMSSLGSRYVAKAEAILEGVAIGVFPA